jgi:hypothetical protein
VDRDNDTLRYAVRQPARLIHQSSQAHAEIEGVEIAAWTNGRLEQLPDRLVLEAGTVDQTLRLPTGVGVTSAHRLFIDFDAQPAEPGRVALEAPASPSPDLDGPEPDGPDNPGTVEDHQTGDHAATYYQLLVSSTTERDALLLELDAPGEEPLEQPPDRPEPSAAHETPAVPPTALVSSDATSVWTEDIGDAHESVPADREPPTAPQETGGLIDGVPWASGESLNHSLSVETPAAAPQPSPSSASLPTFRPFHPVPPQPSAAEANASSEQTPLYPLEPEPGAATDEASVTISRAALLRQLAEEHGSGPTLLALRCALGHLSPTYSATCRVCGASLADQAPIDVPRPPLGRLALSNGGTVLLDRGVIFGRAPQSDATDPADRPNLVRLVDSGEISRIHASVVLDGWQVLLRDLGSQNGTILTLPGHEPEQIRPHEDYVLEPGSVISFADVVTCKFEVTE